MAAVGGGQEWWFSPGGLQRRLEALPEERRQVAVQHLINAVTAAVGCGAAAVLFPQQRMVMVAAVTTALYHVFQFYRQWMPVEKAA